MNDLLLLLVPILAKKAKNADFLPDNSKLNGY